jgi:hypothetical protein
MVIALSGCVIVNKETVPERCPGAKKDIKHPMVHEELMMKSANGMQWRVTVNENGDLIVEPAKK